jgi:hypothetical protein
VISRNLLTTIIILLAGLIVGYLASRGVIGYLSISYEKKDLSALTELHDRPETVQRELPLRIVDLGGVGVLPDTSNWGSNYEHNQHFFEDVMLASPPFLDTVALARERNKLTRYAQKMSQLGYNAIAIPFFLEFINFDKLGDGRQIYGEESSYRIRHTALSSAFGELMEVSAIQGLGTYLWTDMVTLTTPLENYFQQRFGSVNTENEALWEIYELAAEEIFEKFPKVEGIILRIGEAGSVYNKPGWDYRSELYVRTEKSVQLMLKAFLAAAEKYDRTIIFRTWSVGVGKIGDMHTNPDTYLRVLGEVQSDHLVVSTKYCEGDFYSWLPLNPTLYEGDHRRITEIQAKREFEGFGSFPNYVAPLHQVALQSFTRENPRMEGVWVWTQYGGPLRAGPMIIYPFFGFNVINDLNVFAVSQLIKDPYTPLDSITAQWVRDYFGTDSTLIAGVTECMNSSYQVMLRGLYISEFAQYYVKALGLEPPPMLWIFEWDILGASTAVFSNIYYITRDRFQEVIDEGFEAVRGAVALKERLLEVRGRVTIHEEDFAGLIASVEYEIELFRLLDYYRQFFMHYYRWIDTGDQRSRTAYQLAMGQFKAVASFHQEKYGADLNTLGMDLEETDRGITVAEHTFSSVRWARVFVILTLFLLIMGIPGFIRPRGHRKFAASLYFDSIFRPYTVNNISVYHSSRRLAMMLLALYILGFCIFSSFAALWFTIILGALSLFYCLLLGVLMKSGRSMARIIITLLGPRLMIMTLFLVMVAIRGPGFFWFQVWISDLFKMGFLSLLVMMIFRQYQVYIVLSRKWGRRNVPGSAAMVFFALGIQLLLAGGLLSVFGLEESLTTLNNELLILPGGLSKIMGITTHLGIPVQLPQWIMVAASVITLISLTIFIFNRKVLSDSDNFI